MLLLVQLHQVMDHPAQYLQQDILQEAEELDLKEVQLEVLVVLVEVVPVEVLVMELLDYKYWRRWWSNGRE